MAIEGHLERGVQHRRLQAAVLVQAPAALWPWSHVSAWALALLLPAGAPGTSVRATPGRQR